MSSSQMLARVRASAPPISFSSVVLPAPFSPRSQVMPGPVAG
jgi:hypothetical protein